MTTRETATHDQHPGTTEKGLWLHRAGNLAGAEEVCRNILGAEPDNLDTLNLMAVVHRVMEL